MLRNLAGSIAILGLSWTLAPANLQAQCNAPPSLDGLWRANDGGTYQVRIAGTDVWWIGMSRDNGRTWTNVFKGSLNGGIITGQWADVGGRNHGSGTLTLRVSGTRPWNVLVQPEVDLAVFAGAGYAPTRRSSLWTHDSPGCGR
jgi:hypothetical protein